MSESNYPSGVTNATIDEHFGSDDSEAPKGQNCKVCSGTGAIIVNAISAFGARYAQRTCNACGGDGISMEVLDDGDEE